MRIDPSRAARWRERAQEYRVCAQACISEGAKLAYIALAEGAEKMAARIEQGTLIEPAHHLRVGGSPPAGC